MAVNVWVMYLVMTALTICWALDPDCDPGTIVEKTPDGYKCTPCPPGTFSATRNSDRCERCTIRYPTDRYVKVETPCRPDQDTVLQCRDPNMYFDSPHKTCRLCAECKNPTPFVARACAGINNTLCCEKEDMILSSDEVCVDPGFCTIKERLIYKWDHSYKRASCEPCPQNFTNYDKKHLKKSCKTACMDVTDSSPNSQEIVKRYSRCNKDEDLLGRFCYQKEIVLCKPCPVEADDTITGMTDDDNDNDGDDYLEKEWKGGAMLMLFYFVVVIGTLGICYIYERCKN